MNYSCHFTSSLVKNGSKTIKGGICGYVTQFWIFSQLVGNLSSTGCCEDLRKAAISPDRVSSKEIKKKKKRDISLPAQLTAQVTPPPAAVQNQGEGRKIPLMKTPWSPSAQPPTSLLPTRSTKLPKNYPGTFSFVSVVFMQFMQFILMNKPEFLHLFTSMGWKGFMRRELIRPWDFLNREIWLNCLSIILFCSIRIFRRYSESWQI